MKRNHYFLAIALSCMALGMSACGGKNADSSGGVATDKETEAAKSEAAKGDASETVVE